MDRNVEKAFELIKNSNYAEAIELFLKILDSKKEDAGVYNNLALCYYYLNDNQNAEKYYLKAIETAPCLAEAYLNLTDLYFRNRNFSEAIGLLQTGCAHMPENMVLAHYLARVYMEDSRLDLAIDELDKVIESQPENYDAYYDLARVHFELGNYNLAIENFENVLEHKMDNEWVYYYLAQAHEANDEIDKAISNYLRALTINEDFPFAHKKLGVLFLARSDYDDSIEYFENYINMDVPEQEIDNTKKLIERIKALKGKSG